MPTPANAQKLHDAIRRRSRTADWYSVTSVNLAIGQGDVAVTPAAARQRLRRSSSTAAPATSRRCSTRSPRRSSRARSCTGRLPKVAGHIDIPPAWYASMLSGFDGVTKTGWYGRRVFDTIDQTKFDIAGKTGTAETSKDASTTPSSWATPPSRTCNGSPRPWSRRPDSAPDTAAPVVDQLFQPLAATGTFPAFAPTIPWLAPPTATTLAPASATTTTTIPGDGRRRAASPTRPSSGRARRPPPHSRRPRVRPPRRAPTPPAGRTDGRALG